MLAILSVLSPFTHARAEFADPVLNGVTPTLPELLVLAEENHPAISAEKHRAQAQHHRAAATQGFYDPQLEAGLLQTGGPLRSPDSFLPGYVEADSIAARGGVSLPLDPGVRLRASLTHWQPYDSARRDGHATVAGFSAEIPLLKDRGFETAKLTTHINEALAHAADANRDTVIQNVRYNVSVAYVAYLRSLAAYQETLSASNRADRIYSETRERVKLTANAAYELHTARMEIAFRTDDVLAADNAKDQALIALLQAVRSAAIHFVGDDTPPSVEEFHRWADLCRLNATNLNQFTISDSHRLRPEISAASFVTRARYSQKEFAENALKSDLSLRAGIGWRLHDSQWGYNSGDTFGWEAGIVWSRPFGLSAERENIRSAEAEWYAAAAELNEICGTTEMAMFRARAALESALQRFELVQLAVDEAQKSLAAEEERFRLGEGRTRNVLDAQKDLTNANLRSHDVAAELLRAYFDLAHATGQLAP